MHLKRLAPFVLTLAFLSTIGQTALITRGELLQPLDGKPSRATQNQAKTRLNSRDGLTYVWIAPGTFQMGCSPEDNECLDLEKPVH